MALSKGGPSSLSSAGDRGWLNASRRGSGRHKTFASPLRMIWTGYPLQPFAKAAEANGASGFSCLVRVQRASNFPHPWSEREGGGAASLSFSTSKPHCKQASSSLFCAARNQAEGRSGNTRRSAVRRRVVRMAQEHYLQWRPDGYGTVL